MGVSSLLGPMQVRELAANLQLNPTKKLGQNFVHDANTVRKIVRLSGISSSTGAQPAGCARTHVLEVGPGLGSLTLGLTETGAEVTAVEIDERLAEQLPETVARLQPEARVRVVHEDALVVRADQLGSPPPTVLVANLPYNVSVPILIHLLEEVPTLRSALVMVQQEVGERLAAPPGSRTYGSPSAKAAWYGNWENAGVVSRQVFWPVPNVDSVLVRFQRKSEPRGSFAEQELTFSLINAAFSQRRKMIRQSLKTVLRNPGEVLEFAGIPETQRAEDLGVADFLNIARAQIQTG
jgi:16S rRNA (adenine1518-N6/adenine1519-N6)-dimethyltransferase